MNRPTFLKAIVAFLVSGSGAFAVAAADNSVVMGEWAFIGATAIASAGAVFGVRNGEDSDPTTSTPAEGANPGS